MKDAGRLKQWVEFASDAGELRHGQARQTRQQLLLAKTKRAAVSNATQGVFWRIIGGRRNSFARCGHPRQTGGRGREYEGGKEKSKAEEGTRKGKKKKKGQYRGKHYLGKSQATRESANTSCPGRGKCE